MDRQQQATTRSPIIKIDSAHSIDSTRLVTARPTAAVSPSESIDLKSLAGDQNEAMNASEQQDREEMGAGSNKNIVHQQQTKKKKKSQWSHAKLTQKQLSSASAGGASEPTHAYKMRWLVLAIFCSHSAINSFQWIQYSSITNIVSTYYGVSNLEVNLTSLVYMITYIPFIIHASLMLERVGLKNAIVLGATGTFAGSCVKVWLGGQPSPASFWGLMLGQTIVAMSQLFIISIPPLLASVWFPDHQVSTATGIGVFGNQLGIALGFIVPPALVSGSSATREQLGVELEHLTWAITGLSLVIALLAHAFLKDKPPKPPGSASLHAEHQLLEQQQQQHHHHHHQQSQVTGAEGNTNDNNNNETFKSIKELSRDRDFQLLTVSYGINVGVFYAVSTVLNQMVAKSWANPDDLAGTMGLLIVVSGMAGSVMCGQLLDRTHAFKTIIVLIYLLSLVSMMLFTLVLRLLTGPWPLYLAATTLGFFMTGYLPLGFEFAAEITYPHPANTPAGLLNLSAQIFGLVLTYSSSLIVDKESGDLWANLFLTACLAVGLILTAIMKADLKRQKAVAEEQVKSC